MAESVKVIDPDLGAGYDYDSLFDWEAAQQADIDTSNTIAVAKCRCTGGTADTTVVTIDGWTTSAADYIKIWTDPAESYRHNGSWSTGNKYRLIINGTYLGVALRQKENYTRIDGLQVEQSDTSGNYVAILSNLNGTGDARISNTIVRAGANSLKPYGIAEDDFYGYLKVWNCLIIGFLSGITQNASAAQTLMLYNCTIVNCTTGYEKISGTATLKNCLFSGCTTDATGAISDTYCATTNDNTKGLTAVGTGNRFSQTFTFVGAPDYHLASNDEGALGFGLNLYNDATYPFQDDIDGQDRGGAAASWDIGADEYVSAVTNLSIFASECVGSEGVFG